jgi:hypothetical protein
MEITVREGRGIKRASFPTTCFCIILAYIDMPSEEKVFFVGKTMKLWVLQIVENFLTRRATISYQEGICPVDRSDISRSPVPCSV